jgi:phosphatidylglycerophosphate synthase
MRKINDDMECPCDNFVIKICEETAPLFKSLNFTPNMITTVSLMFGLLAYYAISIGNYKLACLHIFLAYYFDCLDGYYARQYKMETEFGDYYDHFSDTGKFILITYGIYLQRPDIFTFVNISIVSILLLLSLIHLGCQEKYHDEKMSPSMDNLKYLCNDRSMIGHTKYFGTGTLTFGLIILVYNL